MFAGTGNIVTQGADLLAGGTITLSGRAIDLQAVRNETRSHTVAESSNLTIGSALAGPLGSKINAIGNAIEQAQHTDNGRLQGALVLKAGYDAYKLTQGKDVTSVDATGTTEATTQVAQEAKDARIAQGQNMAGSAGAASASSGIGISVSIGSSKSSSESSTHDTQVLGTNLQARDIVISASETDLHMAAAKLQAETIALSAKRDVILEAAANTSELASSSSGSSVGGGVTFAFGGQQSGLSFQLNASRSQGKADGNETVWDNTQISATDKLSVTSGRDTTLKGAQVSGGTVLFDVGGKLLIETLQDSSKYDSTQSSSGFSVSVCWFFCAGVPVIGSVGVSEQSIKHSYLSAVGQSGIAAGDGVFDIRVKGETELVGAAITSSAAAGDNRLTTASLSSRDLENAQRTQSSGSSLSVGYDGGSMLTTLAGNAAQNVMGNLQGNAALPKNGSQSGTTQSVISPATITITGSGDAAKDASSQQTAEQLTARDAASANGSLTNTLTLQQAQALPDQLRRQQENMEAAKLVGAVLSNVVGDLASSMKKPVDDARLRLQIDAKLAGGGTLTEGESTQLARLNRDGVSSESATRTLADPEALATNANWQDGSVAKTALHGMVGLIEAKIGGGSAAAGALGAMSQEVMAPILSDYLEKNGFVAGRDDYKALMQLGATLVGTAVGALATGDVKGASTGANAAFVGVTNNYLLHDQKIARDKALAKCTSDIECQKIRDTYQNISDSQDKLALQAIENAKNCVGIVACAYAQSELEAINKEILGVKVNGEILPSMRNQWAAAGAALQEVERRYLSADCDASPVCTNARTAGALLAGVGAVGGLYKLATFCLAQPLVCNTVGIEFANLAGAEALPTGIGVATVTSTGVKIVAAEVKGANSVATTVGIVQLEARSAAAVNGAMVTAGNQPAWLANTNVVKELVPAGTQYQMVISEAQAQALARGESWFGGWATPDAVTSQAYARNNLSILPEFKPDVSYVVTVKTTAPQIVNSGLAGPLGVATGGSAQVEFVGTKNLQLVGLPQRLPVR